MKRPSLSIVLVAAALVAGPVSLHAQVSVGITGGPTFSTFSGDDAPEGDEIERRSGFFVGATLGIPLGGVFSLGTGGYYVQKGATDKSELGSSGQIDLDYIVVPALVQLAVTSGEGAVDLSLFGGPSLGFNTSCDAPEDPTLCDNISDTDFSVVLGAGLSHAASESVLLRLGGGIDIGLTSLDNSEFTVEDLKNRVVFLSGGVSWIIGG